MGSVEIIHARKLDVAGAIAKGNAGQKGGVMEVATFFDVEDVFLEVGGVLCYIYHVLSPSKSKSKIRWIERRARMRG